MKELDTKELPERISVIRNKYGELLTLENVADLFKYNTIGAVRKAHNRGTLPIHLYKFPHKSGLYAKAEEAAKAIEEMSLYKPVS